MHNLENQAYKPPEGSSTFINSWHFKYNLAKSDNFNDLSQIAKELGFTRVADLPTKKACWQIYDRPDYDVSNFPDGTATRISSTLALYDTKKELIHVILRTSQEPHPSEEFAKDLDSFTKHYIERPHIFGFPSQELTRIRNLAIAIPIGAGLLSTIDYYLIQDISGSLLNTGAILGGIGGPAVYGTLWTLSERHARKQISHPEQYTAGDYAKRTLLRERSHNITVAIQKELYRILLQEGMDFSPDQFLEKIYGQIPKKLIKQRHEEVEQAQYHKLGSPIETGNSLPKLIQASHTLQLAESYLQLADKLKQSLVN